MTGKGLSPNEEVTLSEGDSISFGRSESNQYPHVYVLQQLQHLISAPAFSPSPERPTPLHVDVVTHVKTEPSSSTQLTAQPVCFTLDMPMPSDFCNELS